MCLFLLPLKINARIKEKLLEFGPKNAKLIPFSEVTYERPGGVWDALLAKWIKKNRGDTDGSSTSSSTLSDWMLNLRPPSPSQEDVTQERVARDLIFSIEEQHSLSFFDSKFPLFGFMREVAIQMRTNIPSCIFGKEKLMPLQAVGNSISMSSWSLK